VRTRAGCRCKHQAARSALLSSFAAVLLTGRLVALGGISEERCLSAILGVVGCPGLCGSNQASPAPLLCALD